MLGTFANHKRFERLLGYLPQLLKNLNILKSHFFMSQLLLFWLQKDMVAKYINKKRSESDIHQSWN